MNFASEPPAGRRDAITFVVCLLLSVIARAVPVEVSAPVASALRESVLVPFISLQHQTQLVRDRRAAFTQIVIERDSALMLTNELSVLRAENARLRTVLGLSRRISFFHVAADVLHQVHPTDSWKLIISAGTNHGVREFAPVIGPDGLVGYVFQVDLNSSIVLAWTDPTFRASASTPGGEITGLVAPRTGTGPVTSMEFREVAHLAELREGTPIVTTGLGGVYPRGILIGYAGPQIAEQKGLSKTYRIEPATYPASVAHVLVLLPDSSLGVDLTPLFVDSLP